MPSVRGVRGLAPFCTIHSRAENEKLLQEIRVGMRHEAIERIDGLEQSGPRTGLAGEEAFDVAPGRMAKDQELPLTADPKNRDTRYTLSRLSLALPRLHFICDIGKKLRLAATEGGE
jgi:hypothetical protein